jgi:hypothetical protein
LELQIILSYSTYSKPSFRNLWLTTIEYLTVILFFLKKSKILGTEKKSIFEFYKKSQNSWSLIKENSKSVLEQWVNQFSDELYSWAF